MLMKILLRVSMLTGLSISNVGICQEWPYPDQLCSSDIPTTTPDSDFVLHENGTTTHLPTGLIWMRCAVGQDWNGETCIGDAMGMDWPQALQTAKDHDFAGYSDWRVPDYKELNSILELACFSPAINLTVFPNTPASNLTIAPNNPPSWFWSSSVSLNAMYAPKPRFVGFSNGTDGVSLMGEDNRLRLVRGGVQP
ncbi:DUF1566 domain-containing protein [Arsukibacterium tuosuense]|nr:DUF1566 domain-containing protein [Arsukibacterium tuosuense]